MNRKFIVAAAVAALFAAPAAAFEIQLGGVGVIGGAGVSGAGGFTYDTAGTNSEVQTLRSGPNVVSEALSEGYGKSDSTFQSEHADVGIGPLGIGGYSIGGGTVAESGHRVYSGVQSSGNGSGSASAGGSSHAGGLSAGAGGSLNVGGAAAVIGGNVSP